MELRPQYGARLGGPLCHASNPILRLFSRICLQTTSDNNQASPHKKHNQHDKHHHHGGGAARPSSGVDLMGLTRKQRKVSLQKYYVIVSMTSGSLLHHS